MDSINKYIFYGILILKLKSVVSTMYAQHKIRNEKHLALNHC